MRLRLAMRISEVSPALAKETVEEVMGNPTKYPIMESNDDNAFFWWIGTDPNYYEPMADGYRTRKTEYCAADVIVDHMNTREDLVAHLISNPQKKVWRPVSLSM